MAVEFVPLETLLGQINDSLNSATERVDNRDSRTGGLGFTVGECTLALSVELMSEGSQVLARFPSAIEGERVPPEFLSRVSLNLRRSINIER